MLAAQLLWVLVLLAVCCFAPGFFIVRRFAWAPLEKLCGSIALSLILLYLAAWAIYVLAPGSQPAAYFAVSGLCAVAAAVAWREITALFRVPGVRRALAGFGFLQVWAWLMLANIRVYSGAGWTSDWQEHFQRSLFFLDRFPTNTVLYPGYQLPARPPLMNVLGAFFLGQAGDRFEVFQFIFVFLNLVVFLACCLLLPALSAAGRRHGGRAMLPLVAVFAMSPLVMESATYTWTKALTAFFVILAIALYLKALRKGDMPRMTGAFLALAAGLLTHYSAGPYVVILTAHYLIVSFRKRGSKFKELAAIAALCGLLVGTWFAWSLAVYGTHTTFASNTSITSSQQYQGSNLEKIAGNLFDTIVPPMVRDPGPVHDFDQPDAFGTLRDNMFILYQTNLLFGMGIIGGPLVVLLVFKLFREKNHGGPQRSFWLVLIPSAILLGVAVVGERDMNGLAHLTLVPLELVGLTCLAAAFQWRRWIGWLVLTGMLLDFPLGIFLQARIQNLENSPGHTIFTGLSFGGGTVEVGKPGPESLSRYAWDNWVNKHEYTVANQWLQDLNHYHQATGIPPGATSGVRKIILSAISEDKRMWQGWYSRHGGSVPYFGDLFGSGWAPSTMMLAIWVGMLWTLWRNLPAAEPEPKAVPKGRTKGSAQKRGH